MKKKENVLVTGAAGYLGSILVPELLSAGYQVTALDQFIYNQNSLLDVCADPHLKIVRGDVRDRGLVEDLVKEADILLPLACLTGAPVCAQNPDTAKAVNLDAIKFLLKIRSKSQRIVFPTTNSGYGIGQKNKACDEKTPLRPISLYGKLKVDAEKAILDSGNAITLRLATVFGTSPRMRLDLLVNDFVYRAVYDGFIVLFEGHFKRNYVHVRDVAKAFLHSISNFSKMKNEAYNVGLSDCNISKLELCRVIQKHVKKFYFVEARIGKDPDQRDYVVSNAKVERTGFKPDYSLEDGIQELIKGYQILKRNQFANV